MPMLGLGAKHLLPFRRYAARPVIDILVVLVVLVSAVLRVH